MLKRPADLTYCFQSLTRKGQLLVVDVNPQLRIYLLVHIQSDHIRWVNPKPSMAADWANLLHSSNFRQHMLACLTYCRHVDTTGNPLESATGHVKCAAALRREDAVQVGRVCHKARMARRTQGRQAWDLRTV